MSEIIQVLAPLYDGIMQLLELSLKHYDFSLMDNGIFRPMTLQWVRTGPLIMPIYTELNLRRSYIKQL